MGRRLRERNERVTRSTFCLRTARVADKDISELLFHHAVPRTNMLRFQLLMLTRDGTNHLEMAAKLPPENGRQDVPRDVHAAWRTPHTKYSASTSQIKVLEARGRKR